MDVQSRSSVQTSPTRNLHNQGTESNSVSSALQQLNLGSLPETPRLRPPSPPPKIAEIAQAPQTDRTAIKVETKNYGSFDIDTNALPEKLQNTSDLQQVLARKIENGGNRLNGILEKKAEAFIPITTTDVSDIAWFIFAKSAKKVDSHFVKGAMTLPDPDGKIRQLLDKTLGEDGSMVAYQRSSSHLSAFQEAGGPTATQRGIDLRDNNSENSLPNGLRTLLYGSIPKGSLGMKEDRLYLKMEERGAPVSTLTSDKFDKNGPKGQAISMNDIQESGIHGLDFLKKRNDFGLPAFREQVPKAILNGYRNLIQEAEKSKNSTLVKVLTADNAMVIKKPGLFSNPFQKKENIKSGSGIQGMMNNIKKAESMLNKNDPLYHQMQKFQADINKEYNHAELRVGNEIVFDQNDLRSNS